jgi:Flp pilus assembly protein TadG
MLNRKQRRSLLRCRKGSTALEFAFVLPVMVWMMSGALEFAMYSYTSAVMEGSVHLSSRLGKTGYTEEELTGVSREDMILQMIRDQSFVMIDTNDMSIETKVYGQLSNIQQPEPYIDSNNNGSYNLGEPFNDINGNGVRDVDMGAAGLGDAEDIVVYTVVYPYRVMTPFLTTVIGDENGEIPIRASVIVKNEPWEKVLYGDDV